MTSAGESTGNNIPPIKLSAPTGGVTRGYTYVQGANAAVSLATVLAGETFEAIIAGPVWAAKGSAADFSPGDKVYLDTSTGLLTDDNGKTEIGAFALTTAGLADSSVRILLAIGQGRQRRVVAHADAATVTPNADTTDLVTVAELSQTTTFANPTGTPMDGQVIEYRIKSTSVRTISFGNKHRASTDVALLTATAGSSLTQRIAFEWNAAASKWDALSTNVGH